MISAIARWVISRRWLVVIGAILSTFLIFNSISQMPLDVFPSFAPPQVEIQTEAPGLAPEEVESLVTRPIESAINGTPGVETVRSSSAVGISVVKVIFGWDTEIYRARQLVQERLQQATSQLPQGVEPPQISPVNSPLGAIIKYGFTTETTPLMEVRRIVDWEVKNRLLAVPGVTQIVIFGGDERQYQVLVDPNLLKEFNVSLKEVTEAVEKANVNAPGGFLITPDQELLIRGVGRIESFEQLEKSAITARNGTPILLSQVADVKIGAALKRGDGSLNGKKAIIVVVNKHYLLSIIASTVVALTLTPALCALLLVNRRLPDDETWIARQSHRLYRPALMFSIHRPKIVLIVAIAGLVASTLVLPNLGRVFLPTNEIV